MNASLEQKIENICISELTEFTTSGADWCLQVRYIYKYYIWKIYINCKLKFSISVDYRLIFVYVIVDNVRRNTVSS